MLCIQMLVNLLKTEEPEVGPNQVSKCHCTQLLTETGFYCLFMVTEKVEAEWLSNEW